MSKFGCVCGHTIRDQTDAIPYKASLLPDVHDGPLFDWLVKETPSYVEAVLRDSVGSWLLSRGYGADYIKLNLDHGDILHDHIRAKYREHCRDVYQCTECHRIHIQLPQSQMFASYLPSSETSHRVFLENHLREP